MDKMEEEYKNLIIPVFVYSSCCQMTEQTANELKTFFKNSKAITGVWPIVVLTHKMSGDFSRMERIFRGMGAEEVISLENYTREDNRNNQQKNVAILTFINKALENVRILMNLPRNPKRGHINHRKFVLDFTHEAIVAKEEEETLRKRLEEEQQDNTCRIT